MKVRILHDQEGMYEDGVVLECSTLIQDYKDGLTSDKNDQDLIAWFNKAGEKNSVDFIAIMWGLSIEYC